MFLSIFLLTPSTRSTSSYLGLVLVLFTSFWPRTRTRTSYLPNFFCSYSYSYFVPGTSTSTRYEYEFWYELRSTVHDPK
uniref:Secreted protein n=1 Tax=Meloidogyne incognita TaxID=6306 RepID=A0A914LPZ1_MELIC